MASERNPFTIAKARIAKAAAALGLDAATTELLSTPQREVWVALPVKMDDGSTKIFQGFRVQYNTARGPAKGGIRWFPTETIDTVRKVCPMCVATCAEWKRIKRLVESSPADADIIELICARASRTATPLWRPHPGGRAGRRLPGAGRRSGRSSA